MTLVLLLKYNGFINHRNESKTKVMIYHIAPKILQLGTFRKKIVNPREAVWNDIPFMQLILHLSWIGENPKQTSSNLIAYKNNYQIR